MTPDDKRRLAALRARYRGLQGDMPPFGDVITLLRLLDKAIAERDAIYEAAGNHEKQVKEAEAERDAARARCQRSAEEYAHLASRSLAREDAAMAALRVVSEQLGEVTRALVAHSEAIKTGQSS